MTYRLRAGHLAGFIACCLIVLSPATAAAAGTCPDSVINRQNVSWQTLPVTAGTEIGGTKIELEVAGTPGERAAGLMHRPCLPMDRGMLFQYDTPEQVYYWMKNVVIPLDMVFLAKGRIKAIFRNVPPCRAGDCPHYAPATEVDQVLELNAGLCDELSLKENDAVTIRYYDRR